VAGWVHRRRDHGGLIFIDVRDRTGLLQLVFRPEEAPEAHAAAGRLRGEDVISVSGELVRRDESAVNPELPTGEVELVVSGLEQLADSETPPFQIDEDDPVGEELRLRYRYLDLRKERMRDNVLLRHAVVKEIRDFLSDEGYAAGVHDGPVGEQLCQQHCPVSHVAHEFPQLCEAETEAIAKVLDSHVQRLATIAHGDGVCTTCIPHVTTTQRPLVSTSSTDLPTPEETR